MSVILLLLRQRRHLASKAPIFIQPPRPPRVRARATVTGGGERQPDYRAACGEEAETVKKFIFLVLHFRNPFGPQIKSVWASRLTRVFMGWNAFPLRVHVMTPASGRMEGGT
ncbi:hypothetical protein EVAR_66028_1 [Eumeta japonica]|uniref:Uncharacterized protein n=1 Tax=Eumeta variegata TaxID=151549 RepID=A0A4C1Z7K2_EUMVA|nr:hypothetical protein EVAR_66028_1 [Eumeta japonica]